MKKFGKNSGVISLKRPGNEELIKEAYQGIRPAPGYPACPDHSEKEILFELLNTRENIGVELTESCNDSGRNCKWFLLRPS